MTRLQLRPSTSSTEHLLAIHKELGRGEGDQGKVPSFLPPYYLLSIHDPPPLGFKQFQGTISDLDLGKIL